MLYLFSNPDSGQSFIDAAIQHAKEHDLELTCVFSFKRRKSRYGVEPFMRLIHRLRGKQKAARTRGALGVNVLFVEDVNAASFANRINESDDGVVAGFNQIFRGETISRFGSIVNLHPSVLPLYRGPVPSYWCIENGEKVTGFSLHRVTPRIDHGEVLYQEVVPIEDVRDWKALDQKIVLQALPCFKRYLEHLRTGTDWERAALDAHTIYRLHVDYASFPGKKTGEKRLT